MEKQVNRNSPDFLADLIERAADKLSDDELRELAGMDDEASDALGRIHELCEGIACLVLADEAQGPGRTGCFQSAGAVFDLLTTVATFARRADERIRAANEAGDILAARKRAAEGGFKPRAA